MESQHKQSLIICVRTHFSDTVTKCLSYYHEERLILAQFYYRFHPWLAGSITFRPLVKYRAKGTWWQKWFTRCQEGKEKKVHRVYHALWGHMLNDIRIFC